MSFVSWFLEKPYVAVTYRLRFLANENRVEELGNICEALCLTALSVQDCCPSPAIWHKIKMPSIPEMLDDGEVHSNEDSQGLNWLIKAAGQCEEITTDSYEMTVTATEPAQFDNTTWAFSDLLDGDAFRLGFS